MIKFAVIVSTLLIQASCNYSPLNKNNARSTNSIESMQISIIDKLGADELGMRQYTIGLFKNGPTPIEDNSERNRIFREHLEGLRKLMEEGKLLFQGPILDGAETKEGIRGILIMDCSVEDARELLREDPYLHSGEMIIAFHTLYGSAALTKVPEIHRAIETKSFADIGED